jgi:hypothetical protein
MISLLKNYPRGENDEYRRSVLFILYVDTLRTLRSEDRFTAAHGSSSCTALRCNGLRGASNSNPILSVNR